MEYVVGLAGGGTAPIVIGFNTGRISSGLAIGATPAVFLAASALLVLAMVIVARDNA